jgi:hypothetical protein
MATIYSPNPPVQRDNCQIMKALIRHVKTWLDSISRIQTLLILIAAFGGAWLVGEVSRLFASVTGHWLWIEAIGAFLLFACTFVLVQKRELAKQPPSASPAVPAPALPSKPQLTPRLKKFGTRSTYVHVPLSQYHFEETTDRSKRALLAVFENEVHGSQTTGTVRDVVGRIRYSDERESEITDFRVQEGCWLQASSHEVNFPPNAKHELIIATRDYSQAQIVREAGRYYSATKNIAFTQGKLYVEVSLISTGETLITGHYILVSTPDEFSLTQVEEQESPA